MLHKATRQSNGRSDLATFAQTNFLDMFLFEQFPEAATDSIDFSADVGGGKVASRPRICWSQVVGV